MRFCLRNDSIASGGSLNTSGSPLITRIKVCANLGMAASAEGVEGSPARERATPWLVTGCATLSPASEPEGAITGVASRSVERGPLRSSRTVVELIARIANVILDCRVILRCVALGNDCGNVFRCSLNNDNKWFSSN